VPAVVVEQAGIDTWSPAWRIREGSPAERAFASLASVPSKRSRLLPEPIGGYRVGWFPRERLVFAEGHPGGDVLGCPDDLPQELERLHASLLDYGLQLPAGLAHWDRPGSIGLAGVRRLDATCDLRFDTTSEGLAVLTGVAAMALPRLKQVLHREAGGPRVETVSFHGHAGGKKVARLYDKGVQAGVAARGQLLRPEDQRRWGAGSRRAVEELSTGYVREKFRSRFLPLWKATKGVTVGTPTALATKLGPLLDAGEVTPAAARSMLGYIALEQAGLHQGPARTRRHLRARCRDFGLVLADGVLEEVEVDLHEVLDQCLDCDAWERRG
jgi:hypothetical protein